MMTRIPDPGRAGAGAPLATLLLALSLPPTAAMAADWQLAPGSRLGFTGSSQGESFEGHFGRFDARIHFDPAAPSAARFEVTIDTASVDTDNEERDATLLDADFFAVERWPQATWTAQGARAEGDGFVADGALTLRGTSRTVPLAFRFTPSDGGAVLEGSATLDRLAFGVGAGDWADAEVIAHEVRVRTRLLLRPAGG